MPTRFRTPMIAAAAGLFAVSAAWAASLTGTIRIAGSSTVGPITEVVMAEFAEIHEAVELENAITGTGGGFKRFTVGETDISNASRPVKWKEVVKAQENGIEFIELPVAYDGVTFVANKNNTWADSLTVDQLRQIFVAGSTVDSWDDLNPEWPNEPLRLFIPGTDSGTFDYFKEVVLDEDAIREDISVSENDNEIIRGVEEYDGALGFFGCAYYFAAQDDLKGIAIDGGAGPVMPSQESIMSGQYYPFSRPLFIYVNKQSATRPVVDQFVMYYMRNGARIANEVGYVALPREFYLKAVREVYRAGVTGSIFYNEEGERQSVSIADVFGSDDEE